MALRLATIKAAGKNISCALGGRTALPGPLDRTVNNTIAPQPFVLLESDLGFEYNNNVGFEFPSFSFGGGSMELMAVPKRKVTPHRKGLRNGPKALKPIPVIIRCKICGRVKLPHFFCCSGDRGNTGERSDSNN